MANSKTVLIKIKRQDTPESKPYWEEFELPYRPGMNVTSALMDIAANPVTSQGKADHADHLRLQLPGRGLRLLRHDHQRPGEHGMLGADRSNSKQPITLEPFSKFPVVRDLAVDRSVLFENLKKVKAWVPVDGTYDLGSGPRQSAQEQEEAYPLSRCISCCCCMEACPQFNEKTGFVGAATISQVRLFNTHPTGKGLKIDRLQALMGDGGIQECGYAQNCVEVCPKDIPLTKSIADVGGQVMWQAIKDFFRS